MQAGQTKTDRKASQAQRRATRQEMSPRYAVDRKVLRDVKKHDARLVEEGRKAWASPGHIAAVRAAYILQCAANRDPAVKRPIKSSHQK